MDRHKQRFQKRTAVTKKRVAASLCVTVVKEDHNPIDVESAKATGLRCSAELSSLRTTDMRRRRASVVRQAVVLRFAFHFDSTLTVLSGCVFRFP